MMDVVSLGVTKVSRDKVRAYRSGKCDYLSTACMYNLRLAKGP
jgi:hypothetical protein